MKHYLRNGACNFTYWNMILDDEGVSPWGWRQNSLITIDPDTKEVVYNPEFYLMRHLSRYIEPGAKRQVTSGDDEDILAFVNPDGKEVIMAVNRQDTPRELTVRKEGKSLTIMLQPKSFNTLYY